MIFRKIVLAIFIAIVAFPLHGAEQNGEAINLKRGVALFLGDEKGYPHLRQILQTTDMLVYLQVPDLLEVEKAANEFKSSGILGKRLFVGGGASAQIHLADNLADYVYINSASLKKEEALRVLNPYGEGLFNGEKIRKNLPPETDCWPHPYHGADNNRVSTDIRVRYPFFTQYMNGPQMGSKPQVAVAAGGLVYRAYGYYPSYRAALETANTVEVRNAFNGIVLWKTPLPKGFMMHRSLMAATSNRLFLGDNTSCRVYDGRSGALVSEIVPDPKQYGGTVWKWLAIENGVLYALIGGEEPSVQTSSGSVRGAIGGWPLKYLWIPGYAETGFHQAKEQYPFGFGKDLLAINPVDGKVLWRRHENGLIDSRGMCMKNGRLVYHINGEKLACLNIKTGQQIWQNSEERSLTMIRQPEQPWQEHQAKYAMEYNEVRSAWTRSFLSDPYILCSDQVAVIHNIQTGYLVGFSMEDGRRLWEKEWLLSSSLLFWKDGLYASMNSVSARMKEKFGISSVFEPLTGTLIRTVSNWMPRACVKTTATPERFFYRAHDEIITYAPESDTILKIEDIRPPCMSGSIISDGIINLAPWTCKCNSRFFCTLGLVSRSSADDASPTNAKTEIFSGKKDVSEGAYAWPAYRQNNERSAKVKQVLSGTLKMAYQIHVDKDVELTAPVIGDGKIVVADSAGQIHCFDETNGRRIFETYVGGNIVFAPTLWNGRIYVGSGNGRIYCLDMDNGNILWSFRAAPRERKIVRFDRLESTWPVHTGVMIHDGVAYAAAGYAQYDGIHVYALDARTGDIRWSRHETENSAPIMGHAMIHNEAMVIASSKSPLAFNLKDGTATRLPQPSYQLTQLLREFIGGNGKAGRELFLCRGYFFHNGRTMYNEQRDFGAYSEGIASDDMVVQAAVRYSNNLSAPGTIALSRMESFESKAQLWKSEAFTADNIEAYVRFENALLFAFSDFAQDKGLVVSLDLKTGSTLMKTEIASSPVTWGVAVGKNNEIVLSLLNGNIVCLRQGE